MDFHSIESSIMTEETETAGQQTKSAIIKLANRAIIIIIMVLLIIGLAIAVYWVAMIAAFVATNQEQKDAKSNALGSMIVLVTSLIIILVLSIRGYVPAHKVRSEILTLSE